MKAVFKMNVDCGRMGNLEGVFIAEKEDVENLRKSGIQVYFGEVLGKHSVIYGKIDDSEITFVSDAPEVVSVIESNGLESGFNPFGYPARHTDEFDFLEDDMTVCEAVRKWAELQSV